jgi:hypothetical protein
VTFKGISISSPLWERGVRGDLGSWSISHNGKNFWHSL